MYQCTKVRQTVYPAEHQALFASEMLHTFREVALEQRARGSMRYWYFGARELMGLLGGLLMEWIAKREAGPGYLNFCSSAEGSLSASATVKEPPQ